MSNDINHWTGIGRLTRDPEIKATAGGTTVCTFGIASGRKYKDQEEVSFFQVTCFGKLAEIISQYAKKGKQVAIVGRLRQERWEKDGVKRERVGIVAESVQLLGSPGQSEPAQAASAIDDDDSIPF